MAQRIRDFLIDPIDIELMSDAATRAELAESKPGLMGGAACFRGTRVTIDTLTSNDDMTIDEFLDQFPSVRREQVIGVLLEIRFP